MTAESPRSLRAPAKLGVSGRALWRSIVTDFELEQWHVVLLASACRHADLISRLEALLEPDGALIVKGSTGQLRLSPIVAEVRQHRLTLSRLLLDLGLPPAEEQSPPPPRSTSTSPRKPPTKATSSKASKAANARWSRERRARERETP